MRSKALDMIARHAGFAWLLVLVLAMNVRAEAQTETLRGHGGAIRAIALQSNADRLVSGGFDSAIILWDLKTASAVQVLRHHDSTVNALAALSEDCLASGGEDGRIAIWCGNGSDPKTILKGHTAPVAALLHVPSREMLVSASWDRTIRLWRLVDGAPAGQIEGHDGPVTGLAILPDEAIVSVGYDGQIKITPKAGPGAVMRLETPINAVVVARDGAILTAGGDGKIRIFDRDLNIANEVDLGAGPLNALALSPDGEMIATAGIRTQVTLLARRDLKVSGEILGPGLPVWALAFSHDGNELYSGGADRALRRWNPVSAAPSGRDIASAAPLDRITESEEGARIFRACRACHALTAGDHDRAGPSLHGIMGRKVASAPGYAYSAALKRLDVVWSQETIAKLFEIGPNAYLPGTKMPEQTISDPQARRALVDWLAKVTKP